MRTLVEARPGQGEVALFVRAYKNPDTDPAAIVAIPMLGWRTWREKTGELRVEARVANSVDLATGLPNSSIHDLLPNGDVVDVEDGEFLGYGWRGEWRREEFVDRARDAHTRWLEFRLAAAERLGSPKAARLARAILRAFEEDTRKHRAAEARIAHRRDRQAREELRAKRRADMAARPKRPALGKRFRVLERCGYKCVYCGRPASEVPLQIDHVHPQAQGGTDDESNLVAACRDCNIGKSDRILGVRP